MEEFWDILKANNYLEIGYIVSSMQHPIGLETSGDMLSGGPAENSSRVILKQKITDRNLYVEDLAGYSSYNSADAVEIIGENYSRDLALV